MGKTTCTYCEENGEISNSRLIIYLHKLMDIFAHAIWTNVAATVARKRQERTERNYKKLVSVAWTTFWGIFPDLFAFTIPFVIGVWSMVVGTVAPLAKESWPIGLRGNLAPMLYNYSHSLVVWAVVFLIVWVIYKRPRWELFGWLLHILIDIPSHANGFYLTPVFYPLFNWKFTHGISWAHPIYMLINYSLMVIVWSVLMFYRRK